MLFQVKFMDEMTMSPYAAYNIIRQTPDYVYAHLRYLYYQPSEVVLMLRYLFCFGLNERNFDEALGKLFVQMGD